MKQSLVLCEFLLAICCVQCAYRDNSNDPLLPNFFGDSSSKLRIDSIAISRSRGFNITMNDTVEAVFFTVVDSPANDPIVRYIWNIDNIWIDTTSFNSFSHVFSPSALDSVTHRIYVTINDSFPNTASLSDTFFTP
jgi:hypothetical protein